MTWKRRFMTMLILAAAAMAASAKDIPQKPSTSSPLEITKAAAHSGVIIHEAGSRKKSSQPAIAASQQPTTTSSISSARKDTRIPAPASPINLFMPDEFQFYTLNNNGQLVMKQMTKNEIKSMIAAGGGGAVSASDNYPIDMPYQQTKLPDGEMKVSDVVQNVQNVLKAELSKPVLVHASPSTSIPGSVNSQWTNMLPYILSGGSVDQQDIAQDTGILLPDDPAYVDVVPLHNAIPGENQYEDGGGYVRPAPIKHATTTTSRKPITSEKPIYLLGNMALDSQILGEQETLTTRSKLSSTTVYPKFTTSRPTLTEKLPVYQQSKNATKRPEVATKKAPVYVHADDSEITRISMSPLPIIITTEKDELGTSTQRIHQKTPMFEILTTISSSPMITSTVKDSSHPSKINLGPMGGFKRPTSSQRPAYHPIYESTYRPVFEQKTSYRPIYEPVTKGTSEYRPVFEGSTSRRPVFGDKFKVTQYPNVYQTTGNTSPSSSMATESSEEVYTTRKMSSTEVTSQRMTTGGKETTTPMSTRLPDKLTVKYTDTTFVTEAPTPAVTEKQTQSPTTTLAESEETSSPQESTTFATKESETTKPMVEALIDATETVVPSYETTSVKSSSDDLTTSASILLVDKRTTEYPANSEASTEYRTTVDDEKQDSTTLKDVDTTKKAEFTDMVTETTEEVKTVQPTTSDNAFKQKEESIELTTTANYDSPTLKTNTQNSDSTEYNVSELDDNKSTQVFSLKSETTTTSPVYEKVELDSGSSLEDKIGSIISSLKQEEEQMNMKQPSIVATTQVTIPEDEVSTIKVIPVYDDDIYNNLPSESPGRTTIVVPAASTLITSDDATTTATSYTTQSDIVNLPGLQETFNNYMKEYYDPKLSLTESYDEISGLTTFATSGGHMSLSESKDSGLAASAPIEADTTEELLPTTPVYATETTVYKETTTNEPNDATTAMIPEDKTRIDTPIIYLDVSSRPEPVIKQDSLNISNVDLMGNSSLTRIKTNSPISDVDRIILDAPAPTNTPATVYYTLPTSSVPAGNVASGLIAGYPTYDQVKPVTESVPGTTLYDIVTGTEKIDKTTIVNSEPTSFESYTQIPFESLPVVTKSDVVVPTTTTTTTTSQESYEQTTTAPLIPMEKINDLINQLQNTPPEPDSLGYSEYSNGVVVTTIVPLEKFEAMLNETGSDDESLTTIMDELSRITTPTTEAPKSTYVVIQTLSPSPPMKTSTTEAYTTTKQPTTVTTTEAATATKQKPSSTMVMTVVKQGTTAKPYVTSTISTTKAAMDKIQSTIDKSAGRINLEEEKNKIQPVKPTEPTTKFTMKNKLHYTTIRRPANDGYQGYNRKTTKPVNKVTTYTPTRRVSNATSAAKKAASTSTTPTATTTTTTMSAKADTKESNTEKWTMMPQSANDTEEVKKVKDANPQIVPLDHSSGEVGLDQSNKGLDQDVAEFLNMCNELSFKFWTLANSGLSASRSMTLSPFGMISTLAMIFLGARGLTSSQMNDILKLDDVVTFNPHLVFQNITDTVTLARGQGIENAAFVRALFADRLKVRRIMPFYKEQAQQFYEGAVVDINFSTAGDILRRRTNLLIRKQTGGRIKDFVKTHTVPLRSPLTALSANVFQTSCDSADASSEGRDGEMYFAVSQTVKQRKLVPIPAVVWKSGVSAGYEPSLDATAVALGDPKRPVSLIMIMPGQQGVTAPGDNLERLENRLFGNPADNAFEKLLKVIIPRRIEVQMPKFSHRSIVNVTAALKRMGFEQMFTKTADLKGINGAGHDLYLADMVQMNLFCTCGDNNKLSERHLSETYPGTSPRHVRAWEVSNNAVSDTNNEQTTNDRAESSDSGDSKCDEEEESGDMENQSELTDGVEAQNQQFPASGKRNFDRLSSLRQKINKNRIRWFTPTTTTTTRRRRCRQRRQAETDKPRMKMDKPFLYLIRHNLTGVILHIGRFNPKNQS